MTKFSKKTTQWVKLGFINPAQAKQILDHENGQSGKPWVVWGFLALGILVISIGIISLISANLSVIIEGWLELPSVAKLAIDFGALFFISYRAFQARQKQQTVKFEALLLALALGALASIGLISQIYHSGGELFQALLFWCLITAGLPHLSDRRIISSLWGSALLGSITYALFVLVDTSRLEMILDKRDSAGILLSEPLIAAWLTVIFRRLVDEKPITRVFQSLTLLSFLFYLLLIEIGLIHEFSRRAGNSSSMNIFAGLALALGFAILVNRNYPKTQRLLLLGALGSFVAAAFLGLERGDHLLFAKAGLTILTLVFAALFCAARNQTGSFQILLTLIGIRFLSIYFQALGGLAASGFGLILSGIIIIAAVMMWNKYRRAINSWAEGMFR